MESAQKCRDNAKSIDRIDFSSYILALSIIEQEMSERRNDSEFGKEAGNISRRVQGIHNWQTMGNNATGGESILKKKG